MLALARTPEQPSNLHWSTRPDGAVTHTYSKNQIAAALQEARHAEKPGDGLTISTQGPPSEPDARRRDGCGGRVFGNDMTNVAQQGEGGAVQVSPEQKQPRGRRSLDGKQSRKSSASGSKPAPAVVLPEIVDSRISGENPVSKEFLARASRVGRAHGLIVRDRTSYQDVWTAVLVACHARAAPRAHLAFARFLFACGAEYTRYVKRKFCYERRDRRARAGLPSDEELRKRRALCFARGEGDVWRPFVMQEQARRTEDQRRALRQRELDTAKREAEMRRRAAEEERRRAEAAVRDLVAAMVRHSSKAAARPAAPRDSALARRSAPRKQPAKPEGNAAAASVRDLVVLMLRQAASKESKPTTPSSPRMSSSAPRNAYRSNGELRAYPTSEDLRACWSVLFPDNG
ncbi:hypothetical protein HDZ31DRAFT_63815 [Schizophyllum fasciatum]